MVSGGYQQPQRGFPRQDSYQPQPDHGYRQHYPPEPQANYRQEHYYDQYQDNGQVWDDQYAQDQQRGGRYHEEQYQYEDRRMQTQRPPPQFERRPERAYHYDERYHSESGQRPQPRHQPNHGSYGREGSGNPAGQHPNLDTRPPPPTTTTARERILQSQPESPKTVPWDNPFGAFPSKKKQAEEVSSKRTEQRSEKPASPNENGHDDQRSFASYGQSQSAQSGQLSTSHGRQSQGSAVGQHRSMDSPREPYNPEQRQNGSYEPVARQPPQRAMTGPVPQRSYDEHNPIPSPSNGKQPRFPERNSGPTPQYGGQSRQMRPPNGSQIPRSDPQERPFQYQRSASSENYHQGHEVQRPGYFEQEQDHDRGSSQSSRLPPVAVAEKPTSPDVPNFDAMTNNTNEDQLGAPQRTKPFQPYQKATYGVESQSSVPAAHDHNDVNGGLSSDFAQFSFDLPSGMGPSPSTPNLPMQTEDHQQSRYEPELHTPVDARESSYASAAQHLPRTASRGNMRYTPQYDHPPLPEQEYAQPQNTMQQPDAQRGRNTPGQHQNYDLPGSSTRQLSHDPSRSGFDPRLLPRGRGTPGPQPPYQQQPPRPRTSNSMQQLQNNYDRRSSSESFQPGVRSNTDSLPSRPVPFRPGLMQAPPQPSTPVNTPPPPQQIALPAQNKKADSTPVTPQELNRLRDAFRNNPNDYGLGLRFAKKLVEASKVLVNDGSGRMDPKQLAKNRERYVLDAHKVIKKLINAGDPEAMFYMADCYGQGLLGLQADPKEAFSLYQSAAKVGHAQGAYRVAVCCELGPEEGGGTRRDPLKAVQWYKRAASLGDPPAMYKMGMIQLKGLLGQPRNPREAISWLKRAAERADEENPHALHELGLLYESAQSTDIIIRDEKYALQLFAQAAELGYKYSQFKLGSTYEYGLLGCPIDPRMSIAWYSRAAAQGEHQSEFALSGWYLTGGGQPPPGQQPLLQQSDTEAYLWARKAASSGLAKAEFAMGYYTEVGIGVAANVDDAKKWYFRAAAQNHPKARERLEELKRGGARMQKTRVSRSNVGKHNEGECTVM